jgi:transcriptional regulator with XRE-family HTH domain
MGAGLQRARAAAKMTRSPPGGDVGRKRSLPKFKPNTVRRRFAFRLHELADSVTYEQIAASVGVSKITVAKWFAGKNTPDLEYWPALAKAFGLKDYRDLLPPS